jgi:hypothetical protein
MEICSSELLIALICAVICCMAAAFLPRTLELTRAWLILQRMPGPKGGIMGQLKYFNDLNIGQHKSVMRWSRLYGGIFRVRLANVNVSRLHIRLNEPSPRHRSIAEPTAKS